MKYIFNNSLSAHNSTAQLWKASHSVLLCVNTKHQFAFISSLFQIKFIEAMIIQSVTYLINLSRFDLNFFLFTAIENFLI